ncbi:MAG: acetyl-CoA carboxylase biotin carboxyl carrier protein [Ignavibacteria bacterium]|nr:MAG: acetyl-CoA carboxylase biotin carboxyl carrier protein [Ignavibacteria bacterium]
MDLALLKKLVRIVERSGVEEIEIEEEGLRIRVAKNSHNNSAPATVAAPQRDQAPAAETAAPPAPPEANLHQIRSPIVGTFYRAPAPDADPYVEVGQTVEPKTVLCIIEAMKLMNEIESDAAGRITKILVENGQPVEYNQPLFLLEPV